MDLVATPKNPIPLGVSTGYIEPRKGCALALRQLAVGAAGAARHGLHLSGPRRIHREIFRGGGRAPAARLCRGDLDWRGQGGPAGSCGTRAKATSTTSPSTRTTHPLHEGGRAAGLPAALLRARSLDGQHGAVQGLDQARVLVHPHGHDRADAEDRGAAVLEQAMRPDRRWAHHARLRQARRAWRWHQAPSGSALRRQSAHRRTASVSCAMSVLDAAPGLAVESPTIGWLKAALDTIELVGR